MHMCWCVSHVPHMCWAGCQHPQHKRPCRLHCWLSCVLSITAWTTHNHHLAMHRCSLTCLWPLCRQPSQTQGSPWGGCPASRCHAWRGHIVPLLGTLLCIRCCSSRSCSLPLLCGHGHLSLHCCCCCRLLATLLQPRGVRLLQNAKPQRHRPQANTLTTPCTKRTVHARHQ